MIKLRRYLKPFITGVLLTVILLIIQVVAELNLPNYMSDIVNIGISQNGIEESAPHAIPEQMYGLITTFMDSEDQKTFTDSYEISGKDINGNDLSKTYENIDGQNIYVLKDGSDVEELERIWGYSSYALFSRMDATALENGDMEAAISSAIATSSLPPIEESIEMAKQVDPSMTASVASMFVVSIYDMMGADLAAIQSSYIINIGLFMLLIALIGGVCSIVVSYFSARIAAGIAKNLRHDVFEKVESFSQSEFDKFSTASLITRSTNDINQVQMVLVMGLKMMLYAPMLAIGGIVMALNKSTSMAWIIAASCLALLGLVMVIFLIAVPKFKALQKLVDRLNLVSREIINGLMVIKVFGTTKFERSRFEKASGDLAKTNLFVNRVMSCLMPCMMLIMNVTCLLIVWVGSEHVADAQMQVGDMMAFMQYAMQIIMGFLMISMMFIFIPRASVSAVRISEILDTIPQIKEPEKSESMTQKGTVEFKNVHFRYNGAQEDALLDISFKANPGETTAFIGATGSGKTTLLNLIPRFYDVTQGEVLVNGVDVRKLSLKNLRSKIGYVPQKSILMSGSIESNIKYGDENMSDKTMELATEIAQSTDFVTAKEDGFKSEISQGGTNVSGGQRQRLSIARALAINPDIYVFDDSFSALDFKTDANLRKALKSHTTTSTVIIVAQRVSTIMDADKIYVIDDGKIIDGGTHKELLKSCPEYLEIASSQLSKEELENE